MSTVETFDARIENVNKSLTFRKRLDSGCGWAYAVINSELYLHERFHIEGDENLKWFS